MERIIFLFCTFLTSWLFADASPLVAHNTKEVEQPSPCRNYTSVKGDTCFGIVTTLGLNRTHFEELNPSVQCQHELKEGTRVCIGRTRVRAASDEAEAIESLLRDGEVADASSLKKTFNLVDANQRREERVVYTGGLDRKTMNVIAIVVIF
ncbi:hypothetical protein AAVH_39405, partial [Aphelenchoides avenae]